MFGAVWRMTSCDLMNINLEAHKYKNSGASSKCMWGLNDIIPIITYFIHITFTLMKSQSPQQLAACKDRSSYFLTVAGVT